MSPRPFQRAHRRPLLRLALVWAAGLAGPLAGAAEVADVPPAAAWLAARTGLDGLVAAALADRPDSYGFPPDVAAEELRLDAPWRRYALPPETVLAAAPPDSPAEATLQATDTWFFPVVCRDSSCALLAVVRIDGAWRAASLGYAGLARELARVRAQWPIAGGYHARLVSSFQARRHLFTVPEADAPNLTLLQVSPLARKSASDYRRLDSPTATLNALRADVRANLDAFPAGGSAP